MRNLVTRRACAAPGGAWRPGTGVEGAGRDTGAVRREGECCDDAITQRHGYAHRAGSPADQPWCRWAHKGVAGLTPLARARRGCCLSSLVAFVPWFVRVRAPPTLFGVTPSHPPPSPSPPGRLLCYRFTCDEVSDESRRSIHTPLANSGQPSPRCRLPRAGAWTGRSHW